MVLFNHATKEVTAKLVYYGPGLCGKTTNLQWVHEHVSFKAKGKMLSLATESDRTLFFDFLPVELGTIRGMRTRVQMYTVPGQVFYDATRKMVLKGADAVVFVADSQEGMLDANLESFESLRRNLIANDLDPTLPMVIQYNKRDLPSALPVEVLNARLNPRNLPHYEAVAFKGIGVEETLKGITKLLFAALSDFYGTEATPPGKTPTPKAATPGAAVGRPAAPAAPRPAPAPPATSARPAPAAPPAAAKPTPEVVAPAPAARPTPPAGTTPPAARPTPTATPPARPAPAPAPPTAATPPKPAPRPSAPTPAAPSPVHAPNPDETMVSRQPLVARPAPTPAPAAPTPAPTPSPPAPRPPAATPKPDDTLVSRQPLVARPAPTPAPAARAPEPAPAREAPPARPAPPAPAEEEVGVLDEAVDHKRRRADDAPPPNGEGVRPGQWVYLFDQRQRGPLDLDDLIDLILTSLREDTKVWRQGMRDWQPANMVQEIAEQIPPPLPFTGAGEEDFPDFNTVPEVLRTALIADEDEGFRKLLALPLAAQGFRIFEAVDGAKAWQLAVEHRPWLMLSDIDLPEIDGFEFCRRVRANSLLSHTPLVFISGSDKFKDRARAQQVGSNDFLSKQTPIRELLIRIQLLLTRYSDLSASATTSTGSVSLLLEGQIEVFGAPGVLQICNQSRLTGIFSASVKDPDSSAEKSAVMGFRDGEIVNATVQDLTGTDAVYAFLAWQQGHFKFVPGAPGKGEPLAQSVEHLLLEGCRLLDEQSRGSDEFARA
jgi:CheY-like chemotaxis protein/signal recognition particle receptor subunit beta